MTLESYLEPRLNLSVKEVLDEEQRSSTLKNPPMMERPPTPVLLSSPLPPLTLPTNSTARGVISPDRISHILNFWGLRYDDSDGSLPIDKFVFRVESLTHATFCGKSGGLVLGVPASEPRYSVAASAERIRNCFQNEQESFADFFRDIRHLL